MYQQIKASELYLNSNIPPLQRDSNLQSHSSYTNTEPVLK